MSAVRTAVDGTAGTHKSCQEGISSLACGDVGRTASGTANRVGFLRCTNLLLLDLATKLPHFKIVFYDISFFKFYHSIV